MIWDVLGQQTLTRIRVFWKTAVWIAVHPGIAGNVPTAMVHYRIEYLGQENDSAMPAHKFQYIVLD